MATNQKVKMGLSPTAATIIHRTKVGRSSTTLCPPCGINAPPGPEERRSAPSLPQHVEALQRAAHNIGCRKPAQPSAEEPGGDRPRIEPFITREISPPDDLRTLVRWAIEHHLPVDQVRFLQTVETSERRLDDGSVIAFPYMPRVAELPPAWRHWSPAEKIEHLLGMSLDRAYEIMSWPIAELDPHRLNVLAQVLRSSSRSASSRCSTARSAARLHASATAKQR